jgi:protein SCO1/2
VTGVSGTDEEVDRTVRTMKGYRRWVTLLAVAGLAVAACGGSGGSTAADDKPDKIQGLQYEPQPDVSTLSLPDVADGGTELPMRADPGKLLVVFFGYTHCPDICPGTMAGVRLARNKLGPDKDKVQVAFGTVDPGRDTDEVLVDYVQNFFADGHALRTEDAARLKQVADAFGVQYEVVTNAQGETEVGHSALAFVVDDQGRIVDAWPFGFDEKAMADDMRLLLDREQA